MDFGILGPLRVSDGRREHPIRGTKQRALLALLLIHRGQVLSVDRIVEELWGDDLPAVPSNALQSVVSKLRRALSDGGESLKTQGAGYVLEVSSEHLDAALFEGCVERGRKELAAGNGADAATVLTEALSLWRGPALEEFAYDDFARHEASRLEEVRLSATEDRIEAELLDGRHGELVGDLEALVRTHPLRERMCGQLMVALYRSGRQAEALRAFQEARRVLGDELGLEPGPELRRLEAAVLSQDSELEWEPTTSPARGRRRTNIGSRLNAFVGRSADLKSLGDLVEEHRLVTVIGTGGAGKTRLALELAARLEPGLARGAWLVELAALGDGSLIADTVATAVGAPEIGVVDGPVASRPPVLDRLVEFLREGELLLVFDDCEHVVGEAALVIERLLTMCPGLRILATSREGLGIPGEMLWPLPPMDIGDAVELFVVRAATSSPAFELTPEVEPAIRDICERLDGLPLAIELAAVRSRTLPLSQLASRIDERFRLLTGGARTAMPRHQTLRAMVDWSYELLFEDERRVFDRLSVFVGGCSLEAAERVCSLEPVAPQDVADILSHLVDKSIVVIDMSGGDARYGLLQTLALYGRERLIASGEASPVRQRHMEYFSEFAALSAAAWRGEGQRRWLRAIPVERENLHAAFEWAVEHDQAEIAVGMAGALGWYWWIAGRGVEGGAWLDSALATSGEVAAATRARAVCWAGALKADFGLSEDAVAIYRCTDDLEGLALAMLLLSHDLAQRGEPERGAKVLKESLDVYLRLTDRQSVAARSLVEAHLAAIFGNRASATRHLRLAVDRFGAIGNQVAVATCLTDIARLAGEEGDYAGAVTALQSARHISAKLGLGGLEASNLARLGTIATLEGDQQQAETLGAQALELSHQLGFDEGIALSRNAIAFCRRSQGRLDEASENAQEALAIFRRIDIAEGSAAALATLGFAAEMRGDLDGALGFHRDGITQAHRTPPSPHPVAVAAVGLAGVSVLQEDFQLAGRFLGAAEALRGSWPLAPPGLFSDLHRISTVARATLGEPGFAAAITDGKKANVDDLLQLLN